MDINIKFDKSPATKFTINNDPFFQCFIRSTPSVRSKRMYGTCPSFKVKIRLHLKTNIRNGP